MADILRTAQAGTLESSDVLVTVEPNAAGLEIELDSVVKNQFGDDILRVVREVLAQEDIQNARVGIVDRGALDCVIRARVETAVLRGKGEA